MGLYILIDRLNTQVIQRVKNETRHNWHLHVKDYGNHSNFEWFPLLPEMCPSSGKPWLCAFLIDRLST